MRKIKVFAIVAAAVAVLALAGCSFIIGNTSGGEEPPAEQRTVKVMLGEGEGFVISGDNPKTVAPGETVSFDVKINDDYILDEVSGGATYDASSGRLVLSNVQYPTTLKLKLHPKYSYSLSLFCDEKAGSVSHNAGSSNIREGSQVTVTATPAENATFLGFSSGDYIDKGGKLLGYATSYTFTMSENVTIYANYQIKMPDAPTIAEIGDTVIYHANGGTVKGSTLETVTVKLVKSNYICPNALISNGTFVRDGYVLAGYNTKPDGSGKFYAPGWNIILSDKNAAVLYAQWLPETPASDFQYVNGGSSITITKYNGNDDIVVIPEKIGGLPVTAIHSNTFSGKSFSTLFVSRFVDTIVDGAVSRCNNFKTLYLSDSVLSITDRFYENCPNFQKLYMCATRLPAYVKDRNGIKAIKYERLITAKGKKLILSSGSNCAYGINSRQLEQALGGEYSVVNYGTNLRAAAVFYVDVIAAHINPGDIHIRCPETDKYQWGFKQIDTIVWQHCEGAYDAFADVDIRNYTNLFSSFGSFNRGNSRRSYLREYDTTSFNESMNFYGDYDHIRTQRPGSFDHWPITFDPNLITQNYHNYLNRAFDAVVAAGGKNYLSFPASNAEAVDRGYSTKTFVDTIEQYLHVTVISKPEDYIFDSSYFYNSDYHLMTNGAEIRTERLARDIKAQLAKEKSGQ